MEPPKCFICEQKHWASEECPDENVEVERVSETKQRSDPEGDQGDSEPRTMVTLPREEYEALKSDADKWVRIRDRQRERMKERRREKGGEG